MTEPYEAKDVIRWCGYVATSFDKWLGRPLLEDAGAPEELAKKLYEASFVLVSHRFEDCPRFCFANGRAQKLWQYDWNEFNGMDSRLSAEPVAQEEREHLLKQAQEDGYIDDYSGVRIAKDGSRFEIQDVILWNVLDDEGTQVGQAAIFKAWRPLPPKPTPLNHPTIP